MENTLLLWLGSAALLAADDDPDQIDGLLCTVFGCPGHEHLNYVINDNF